MTEYKVDDQFLFRSADGNTYTIIIRNINDFRETTMRYAVDVFDDKGYQLNNDYVFIGDDTLAKCEKVNIDE